MNRSVFFTLLGIVLLVIACFLPWMRIDDISLTITGVDTTGTRYGMPALNHFILSFFILMAALTPKVWAKRFGLLFAALNLAWGIRNFGVIPHCEAGVCPQKLGGIYLLLIASIMLMIVALFPKDPTASK